jgi:hypothetical protein
MSMVEMVRCEVGKDSQGRGDVRYVPAEIFVMWRYMMEGVHRLQVKAPRVSVWLPKDHESRRWRDEPAEAVIEVRFRYRDLGDTGRVVTRYFPEQGFGQIYRTFRRHFPDDARIEEMTRRDGYFLSGSSVRLLPDNG